MTPRCIMSERCKGKPDRGLMCPAHRKEDKRIYAVQNEEPQS